MATTIFAGRGFDAASMQDIAEATGISKPAIYKHFPSKESILIEVLARGHRQSAALIHDVTHLDVSPLERLHEYTRRHVVWYLQNPELFRVGIHDWTSLSEDALRSELPLRRRYQQFIRDLVADCRPAAKAATSSDAKFAAAFLRGSINSASSWYQPDGPDSARAIAEGMADLAVAVVTNSRELIEVPENPIVDPGSPTGDRQAKLLAVALELFTRRGYAATSIQDLADEMGILKGSLYHYIDSKYGLLIEIFERAQVQLNDVIADVAAMPATPQIRLRAIFQRQTFWLLTHQQQSAVLFKEWAFLADDDRHRVVSRRKSLESFIRSLVEECQADGLIPPGVNVTRALRFILGAIYSISEWYHDDGSIGPATISALYAEFAMAVFALPTN